MLEFIKIERFKVLLDAAFPLKKLNLFCGLNGMGKSSLIQSLLLLRQSHEQRSLDSEGLMLQGEYLNLGTGKDVLAADALEESFLFRLKWAGKPASAALCKFLKS